MLASTRLAVIWSVVTKDSADRTVKVEDLGTSETDGTSISTAY